MAWPLQPASLDIAEYLRLISINGTPFVPDPTLASAAPIFLPMNDLDLYRDRLECSLSSPARFQGNESCPNNEKETRSATDGFLLMAAALVNKLSPFFSKT